MSPIEQFSFPDRIIHIHELGQRSTTPRGCRQWKLSITCGEYQAVVNLADPFTPSQETRLRWALEEHPIHHPFESHKSRAVTKELWEYSMSLMEQLNLHEILTYQYAEDTANGQNGVKLSMEARIQGKKRRKWYVDIEGCQGSFGESIIHGVHWEALENPDIWPSHLRPNLIIRRKVSRGDLLTHGPTISIRSPAFRILLVVSHSLSQAAAQPGAGRVANPRLTAMPLVDIISKLASDMNVTSTQIQLEIVRPGTWRSLQDHLHRRGKGYFHLVHFDVHGKVTREKGGGRDFVSLGFVSDHSSRKRTWRTAAEVSALLSAHGIKLVVLNATRSAKAFAACEANVAETLIRDGARAVIAFPFKVLNTGKEIFISAFYRCLLTESWDFAIALSAARRAMMKTRQREGRLGIKVSLEDWVVPVLYHSGGTEISMIGDGISLNGTRKSDLKGVFSKLLQVPDIGGFGSGIADEKQADLVSQGEIIGREGDIFRIEAMLDTPVLRIFGSPGIGKSALVFHLCWWWKKTSLVQDSFYYDWHKNPDLSVDMMTRQLYLSLFPNGTRCRSSQKSSRSRDRSPMRGSLLQHLSWSRPQSPADMFPENWFQRTVNRLRETPYLITLDSLDAPNSCLQHDEQLQLKGEINAFIESLQGGKTIVLVVSDKKECWLNDSIIKFGTYHLKGLEMEHAIEFAGGVFDKHGGDRKRFWGAKNHNYLQHLMKLSEMNPLVMYQQNSTLPTIAALDDSPEKIFISLLQGAIPLGFPDPTDNINALRSVTCLFERLDKDSKQLLLCLAPFWKRIPKDIDSYIYSLLHHKALPCAAELTYLGSRKPSERQSQRAKTIYSSVGLAARYGEIIHDLISLELLTDGDTLDFSDPEYKPSPQYYRVHPLLTLSLRQLVEKEQKLPNSSIDTDYNAVTRAFLDYYKQRSAHWADSPDEKYDLAAQEIREEEINFLSAISIPLRYNNPDKLFDIFPLHAYARFASMASVDKKLSSSSALIAHFSELILEQFNELQTKRGEGNVSKIAVETAIFASNWLCEYHSENSSVSVFRAQIGISTELMALANKISFDCQEALALLEEQATKQKSAAVSDGMMEGLRLRKPWNGLMVNDFSRNSMVILEAKRDPEQDWLRLAMAFSRLHSIAVQVPLAARFNPALGEELKIDLKLIWKDCVKSMINTELRPFLDSYEWVAESLETPTKAILGRAQIPSSRFLGYSEFVRSQLMLQFNDTASAKRYLLDGLQCARTKSNHSAEILFHTRLCDLTFELENWSECIMHVELIRDLMVQLGDDLSTADFVSFAQATWRKGICHKNLCHWNAAIEAFDEALGACRHLHDRVTEYAILRKLAGIKFESGVGEGTVTDTLLKALFIAYDPALTHEFTIIDEHGLLLQRIVGAIASQKAGESAQSVIARLACAMDTSGKEMHELIEELMMREKEIVTDDMRMNVLLPKTDRKLTKLYAEAERIMFDPPWALAKQPLRLFAGSRWEKGLSRKSTM